MKLMNCILRPGEVLEVLENGQIKASIPGLFSEEDKDNLPPIYPFFGLHSNSYSQPKIGENVWILNNLENKPQLHWFRKDDYKNDDKHLITEENVEVLCNREYGGGAGWATIYFSDGSGWVISEGDSKIQIRPNGSIILDSGFPKGVIDINSSGISLGAPGLSRHPAAYGDVITSLFRSISATLMAIQDAASKNYITSPISIAVSAHINDINSLIPEINSPNVTLE